MKNIEKSTYFEDKVVEKMPFERRQTVFAEKKIIANESVCKELDLYDLYNV